jgi:hypothetical protein
LSGAGREGAWRRRLVPARLVPARAPADGLCVRVGVEGMWCLCRGGQVWGPQGRAIAACLPPAASRAGAAEVGEGRAAAAARAPGLPAAEPAPSPPAAAHQRSASCTPPLHARRARAATVRAATAPIAAPGPGGAIARRRRANMGCRRGMNREGEPFKGGRVGNPRGKSCLAGASCPGHRAQAGECGSGARCACGAREAQRSAQLYAGPAGPGAG